MRIDLGSRLIRLFAAVLLAMICAACGVPNLVEVKQGSHRYQDSLLVRVILNDSVFTVREISEFIRLSDTVNPMSGPSPQYDSLQRARRPLATLIADNLGSTALRVPSAYWNARIELGYTEYPAAYSIGNSTGVLTLRHKPNVVTTRDYGIPLSWYVTDPFLTVQPHQTTILEDSIDVLALDEYVYEQISYPPGRYWIAFTYHNSWVREGKTNYWTGSISTDTVYFEVK